MEPSLAAIPLKSTIRDTLHFLDERRIQFALVTNEDFLCGVVTDGDIRRSLLAGKLLDSSISDVMNINPKFLSNKHGMNRLELISYMNSLKIRAIPVLDSDRRLLNVYTMDELTKSDDLNLVALIMAGGKGERLRPITNETPKPLIQVGKYSLIERTIYALSSQNVRKIYIAVHDRKEMFFEVLGDGSKYGIQIQFIEESEPMGTAGAISLLPNLSEIQNLLVTNADLIHDIDFRRMLEFHIERESDLTVSCTYYPIKVPFGIVNYNNALKLISIEEKPTFEYPIMCGVNILSRRSLDIFYKKVKLDMVSAIQQALSEELSVNVFINSGHWVDVGEPSVLQRELSYFQEVE